MEKIARKITHYLEKKDIITNDQAIYQYGFEALISSITGTLILLIIGFITNNLKNAIIYELLFTLLRRHTGGYHCKTHFRCIFMYNSIFVFIIFVQKYINVTLIVMIIILLCINVILWIFTPVKNINKQTTSLTYTRNKKQTKLYSFVISMIIFILYIINLNYYKIIFLTFIIITLLVLIGRKENERFIY